MIKVNCNEKQEIAKGGIKVFFATVISDVDCDVKVYIKGIEGAVCYNCQISDYLGEYREKTVRLIANKEQRFWFSVSNFGKGFLVVENNVNEVLYEQQIEVGQAENLVDDNFYDIYNLNRLTWLNSNKYIDHNVISPYSRVLLSGNLIKLKGREIELNNLGFPKSIKSLFNKGLKITNQSTEILEKDLSFLVDGEKFVNVRKVYKSFDDCVVLETENQSENFVMTINAKFEADGFIEYKTKLIAKNNLDIADVKFVMPINYNVQKYFMGLGEQGRKFSHRLNWKWDTKVAQDSFWVGDVNAGLKIKFKGENYVKPLVNIYYVHKSLNEPYSWGNNGKGGICYENKQFVAYSGRRTVNKSEKLEFNFDIMVTPVRELDLKKQLSMRFFHTMFDSNTWLKRAKDGGANIINVHHGNDLNPYINYPFFELEEMKKFVDTAHGHNMKVKFYYTIRELTTKLPEFNAFRDLGYEIIEKRTNNTQFYWQTEAYEWTNANIGTDVIPAWRQPLKGEKYKGFYDSSVITNGQSRLCNFYIEGLNFLVDKIDIDGIYIDDVAFDRDTMKRVRKVLDKKEGSYIDFHQWNHYVELGGYNNCSNMYLELYPYVDKLWIGEGFDYDESPDFWLVEMSGIPYGLMSEMMDTGNQYRGLLFGMTNRLAWQSNKSDPLNMWKLFDDYNLGNSELIGWWDDRNSVEFSNENILASEYIVDGKKYLAIANFSKEDQSATITFTDGKLHDLYAPKIDRFQEETNLRETISLGGGMGLFVQVK